MSIKRMNLSVRPVTDLATTARAAPLGPQVSASACPTSSTTSGIRGGVSGVNFSPMPTVLRFGPYRFFFYSSDRGEPPHVHIERETRRAKFWLSPVRLQESGGFDRTELNKLQALVEDRQQRLLREWDEFFGN